MPSPALPPSRSESSLAQEMNIRRRRMIPIRGDRSSRPDPEPTLSVRVSESTIAYTWGGIRRLTDE